MAKILGDQFVKSREAKGLTLEAVEEATQIKKNYLTAIEEEDYAELPGYTYGLSLVRKYATYLGMDVAEIAEDYKFQYNCEEKEAKLEEKRKRHIRMTPIRRVGLNPKWVFVYILGALLIAFFIAYVINPNGEMGALDSAANGLRLLKTAASSAAGFWQII